MAAQRVRESSKGVCESSKGVRESSKGVRESSKGVRESSKGVRESSKGVRESSKGVREVSLRGGDCSSCGEQPRLSFAVPLCAWLERLALTGNTIPPPHTVRGGGIVLSLKILLAVKAGSNP